MAENIIRRISWIWKRLRQTRPVLNVYDGSKSHLCWVPFVTVSANSKKAYEGYSKLVFHRTAVQQIIDVSSEYAGIDQMRDQNTEWFNRLTRVTKKKSPKMEPMLDTNSKDVKTRTWAVHRERGWEFLYSGRDFWTRAPSYTGEHYIVQWYGCEAQTDNLNLAAQILHHLPELYWRGLWEIHRSRKATKN